jgi:hypothetical protein
MTDQENIEFQINRMASRHIGKIMQRAEGQGQPFSENQIKMIKAQFRMMQDDVCNFIDDFVYGGA